jgi:carbon-monoxide dehydrogenase small subunit
MRRISLTVNGKAVTAAVEPRQHLADFLREELLLTGTHIGCEHGICGACTVAIDGEIARSCITYAAQCDGAEITTIEGFDDDPLMARLRAAFTADHALQCGYCTPGMLIAARDMVRRLGQADETRIREELSGNLCRCTGYAGIVAAIRRVMDQRPDLSALAPSKATLGPAPGPAAPLTAQEASSPAQPAAAPEPAAAQARAGPEEISDAGFTNLTQSFTIDHPPATVWAFLGDLRRVASCMPGAAVTTIEGDRVTGEIRVKLGPIAAAFAGEGWIARDEAERRASILGQGRDARSASRARGRVVYAVREAEAGGTRVEVEIGYALAGPLAQFSRAGIVDDLAGRLTAEFARNLESRLSGTGPEPGSEPAALDAGGLVWSLLRARLKSAWDRILGRGRAAQPPR